jgi:hypothetical protein
LFLSLKWLFAITYLNHTPLLLNKFYSFTEEYPDYIIFSGQFFTTEPRWEFSSVTKVALQKVTPPSRFWTTELWTDSGIHWCFECNNSETISVTKLLVGSSETSVLHVGQLPYRWISWDDSAINPLHIICHLGVGFQGNSIWELA